uniref:D7-related salivary protein n=1 Tax=Phlebotomus orientalis TaxID=99786 RepID=V5K6B9_PHLOR|nr:D7-related salivary protein [Phlebotomus orientalis]
MNNLLTIFGLLYFLGFATSLQFPRDPDQTRWAEKTCLREFSRAPPSLLKKWQELDFPNTNLTHCFIKCFTSYLGVYNETTRKFNVDGIKTQFESQGIPPPQGLETLRKTSKGTCKDIYLMTVDLIKKNKLPFAKAFHGISAEAAKWYIDNKGNVKGKYQKASEFCKSKDDECRLHCRFYYYRFVDEDYQIFKRNIKIPGISNAQLEQCRNRASQAKGCQVAKVLRHCLKEINPENLKATLRELDEISAK